MAGDFSLLWGVPFAGLVLTIALMPLAAHSLWQRHYGTLALLWAASFVLPDMGVHGWRAAAATLVDTGLNEYVPFVALLGTLYVVSGGLRISGAPRGTPAANTGMLGLGVLLGGAIGTAGAALLMLRPVIRANRHRQRTTHIFVFFIVLVANVGGALSPVGNAPLFLGYLRGVPFFWPSVHLALPTLTLCAGLLATFWALDHYLRRGDDVRAVAEIEKFGLEGGINLVLLAAAIVAIMPRVFVASSAAIVVLGARWPVVDAVSDVLLLAIAAASCLVTPAAVRRANDFTWAPLVEVAVLFAAIFVTLVPLVATMAAGEAGPMRALFAHAFAGGVPQNALFYRATGLFSAILDNAPTYLVFFGLAGNDAARLVAQFPRTLAALSAGACYFGGLTYLGNAPNLMVRAIAERHGVRMPSFFSYMIWAVACLVPWLLLVEAIFFE